MMGTYSNIYADTELQEKFSVENKLLPKTIPTCEVWIIKEFRVNGTVKGILTLKIAGHDPQNYALKYFENGKYKLYAPVQLNSLVNFGFHVQGLDSDESVMLHVLGIKMVRDDNRP